ncbi:MAG: PEP/pyruvate-binding domain-containing protein [Deltaproteobacteria bacterium]|nr:PEP/pyruvate-binding domain-containing protein [Deltaproteobacteria bacterium]
MSEHATQPPVSEPFFLRFHDLMPYRIREVLLVSPVYDAFILEEDGRLTERLFSQYSELNLSQAPRIIHTSTGEKALQLLRERRFDLVVTVVRLADMDATTFSEMVKGAFQTLPIILLTFDEGDRQQCPGGVWPPLVDAVLQWTGNSQILMSGIKLIEDHRNAAYDTKRAGLQVIIVVEDSVRRYSTFLALLFPELLRHAASLIAEGVNPLHKLMRLKARPKILLATNYEAAISLYEEFRESLMALITDVRFPKEGKKNAVAGFDLVRRVRAEDLGLPILMQSAEQENAHYAAELGCAYVDKNSPQLLAQIRNFLREGLGFGDFVFRLPNGQEVARARDVYEMERTLRDVPAGSVSYHAKHNHFSLWLKARSMFPQAELVRPRLTTDFEDVEEMRAFLIEVLANARADEAAGMITDYNTGRGRERGGAVLRLSSGSMGGKGRGIAFLSSQVQRKALADRYPGIQVRVPRALMLGTDAFDVFMERHGTSSSLLTNGTEAELVTDFLKTDLPHDLREDLRSATARFDGPIAVRSSSLLEDSRFQPFAGIYATWILPNSHPDPEVRFREICCAVRAVYASTFAPAARSYFRNTPHSPEEEKMGIVIQEVVGRRHGDRFYPQLAGVAQSYNFYPIPPQEAEDGAMVMALGLGHLVVSGGSCLRFSPGSPTVLPQFASASSMAKGTQRAFYALDMSQEEVDFSAGPESNLRLHSLSAAEEDGTLALVASVYDRADDLIRDTLTATGPRVVTMNNILKYETIPVAPAMLDILRRFRRALGGDVEIEFAVDPGDHGKHVRGRKREPPSLSLLQIRPMIARSFADGTEELTDVRPEQLLCRTTQALGHGVMRDVRDVVYVTSNELDAFSTPSVAQEVGGINRQLMEEGRPYLLIGPGRWGTSDPALGIPVDWEQIAGARTIIEVPFGTRAVEPSQGTHFFLNITSLRIGYLTVAGGIDDPSRADGFLDRAWLDSRPARAESATVRCIRFDDPLTIELYGREGSAQIIKPIPPEEQPEPYHS